MSWFCNILQRYSMKLDHCLIPWTQINSKWIKGMNVRPETIKLLEENIGGKFFDTGLSGDVLNLTPKAKATKAKISGTTSK